VFCFAIDFFDGGLDAAGAAKLRRDIRGSIMTLAHEERGGICEAFAGDVWRCSWTASNIADDRQCFRWATTPRPADQTAARDRSFTSPSKIRQDERTSNCSGLRTICMQALVDDEFLVFNAGIFLGDGAKWT